MTFTETTRRSISVKPISSYRTIIPPFTLGDFIFSNPIWQALVPDVGDKLPRQRRADSLDTPFSSEFITVLRNAFREDIERLVME